MVDKVDSSRNDKDGPQHRIKPIYLFETSVRTWLITTPRVLAKRIPSFNRTISLVFMYMMFQVLAILGAFLLNAICSITLDISGLAARHAFDFSLDVSILHAFSTFYVTYSTFRVFLQFGHAMGVIAWESLDDFPDARKIVHNATATWPFFIFIVFIPQCMLAFSLLGTPYFCEGVTIPDIVGGILKPGSGEVGGISQAFPFKLGWQSMLRAAGEADLGDRVRTFVCTRTPLLYFTPGYPNPRRTISAVLVVGLVQYTQILLHRFPNWRADMKTVGRGWRLCVHFTLLACLALTGAWLVGWIGLQLGLVLVDLGQVDIRELGLVLIVAWTVWVAVLALVLCGNAASPPPRDHELRLFFQNLKTSFIVAVLFFFLRGCLSPTMGFIEAQQELTILTIIIPILYVALYTAVNAALQLSVGLVVFGGPAALVMSVQLCRLSGFGGPGTFAVVFLHIFIKLIGLFGDDALTKIETDAYDEDDALPRRPTLSAPSSPRRALSLVGKGLATADGGGVGERKSSVGGTATTTTAEAGIQTGEIDGVSRDDELRICSLQSEEAFLTGAVGNGGRSARRQARERESSRVNGVSAEKEFAGKGAAEVTAESSDTRHPGAFVRAGHGPGRNHFGLRRRLIGWRGQEVELQDVDREVPSEERGVSGGSTSSRGVSYGLPSATEVGQGMADGTATSRLSGSRTWDGGADVSRQIPRAASASPSAGLIRRRLHPPLHSRVTLRDEERYGQHEQQIVEKVAVGVPVQGNSERDAKPQGNSVVDIDDDSATGLDLDERDYASSRRAVSDTGVADSGEVMNPEATASATAGSSSSAISFVSLGGDRRSIQLLDSSSKAGEAHASSQNGYSRRGLLAHTSPVSKSRRHVLIDEASERHGEELNGLGRAAWGELGGVWGGSTDAWDDNNRRRPNAGEMGTSVPSFAGLQCDRCMKIRSYSLDDVLTAAGAPSRRETRAIWDQQSNGRLDYGGRYHRNGDLNGAMGPEPGEYTVARGGGRRRFPPLRNAQHQLHLNDWMRSVMDGNRGVLTAMETNATFVFKGTIRGVGTFLVILSLFLGGCQILSLMQEEKQWYPNLIKYSQTPEKQLVVDNAFVVKATLETTGDPVVVEPRYASCGSKWNGLSLLDYALLAELAYFDQNDSEVPLSEVAEQFFPRNKFGPAFEIKVPSGDHSHAQFFEAYSAKLNVSVVAIRGTDVGRLSDLIEDIKIWVEPIVLKGLSMVFPTIRIWPDSTSSTVIEWLHETLQLFGLQQQAHYYRPLVEYVRAIEGRDIVLTGHSLGGGLARIVGALERATSICFSPPGIAQSYRKFSVGAGSLDRAFLHQMSVSVIPEHDFVPMIDTQVGLIQLISCSTAGKALQLSCHMLEGTICDLITHCGDDRGRFTDCKFEYNMSHLLPHLLVFLQGRMIWVVCAGAMVLIVCVLVILPEFLV